MRRALHVEPPVMHLGHVAEVWREPRVVTYPGRSKGVADYKLSFASCWIVVEREHRKQGLP